MVAQMHCSECTEVEETFIEKYTVLRLSFKNSSTVSQFLQAVLNFCQRV